MTDRAHIVRLRWLVETGDTKQFTGPEGETEAENDAIVEAGRKRMTADIASLLADLERAEEERRNVIGLVQRFQPGGSPPPLGGLDLVAWILDSLRVPLERAETEAGALRAAATEVVAGVDNWNSQMQSIIGRQVDYDWGGLERLRAALAPGAGERAAKLIAAAIAVDGECPMNLSPVAVDQFGNGLGRALITLRAAVDAYRKERDA